MGAVPGGKAANTSSKRKSDQAAGPPAVAHYTPSRREREIVSLPLAPNSTNWCSRKQSQPVTL